MLADVLRKLSAFGRLRNYRYIGFGAYYFVDFELFHKALGITDMISIEKDSSNKARYEFNRPFKYIKMRYEKSNAVLPTLSWQDTRTILWLDYNGRLDSSVLTDVGLFFANAIAGSVIIVSINVQPEEPRLNPTSAAPNLDTLKLNVGDEKIPLGIKERDLVGWGNASVCNRIIHNEIQETLKVRNGGRSEGRPKLLYKRLFNFQYADNAKMLTTGGLLYEETQRELVENCEFEEYDGFLDFSGTKPFSIEVPNLTYREILYVRSQLPCDPAKLRAESIPSEDTRKFAELFRWFPSFANVEP